MFAVIPIFIGAVFLMVIGSIIVRAITGVAEWSDNNTQPVACDRATVVSKRAQVSGGENSTSTTYYTTFEMPGGVRREFKVNPSEYGLLAEDDSGQLSYQGTRYLGFQRGLAPQERLPNPIPANLVCDYCGSAIPAGLVKCAGCGWAWHPSPKDSVVS